ncbi:MAG: tRNA-specific adenosine deaminase subunit tad3 [Bathelium mastoideum]|nr:MAG: tRNA-specific adenosine deaminase subunit tad3 [Bathelium mastoideum]
MAAVNSGAGLVALTTIYECQLSGHTMNAWVVRIPEQLGTAAIDAINTATRAVRGKDVAHLKRVQTRDQVPKTVATLFSEREGSLFLACDTDCITLARLTTVLSANLPAIAPDLEIHIVAVPKYGPTSKERAEKWSESHWPTIYKHTNPFGPHPSMVEKAEAELAGEVKKAMKVAHDCGKLSRTTHRGTGVGCTIIYRDWNRNIKYIAAAADARYSYQTPAPEVHETECPDGHPTLHSVMRAIGMVARKRREAPVLEANRAASGIRPINCAICNREDLDDYYHCDICLEGSYDLCPNCYRSGRRYFKYGKRCWEAKNEVHKFERRVKDKETAARFDEEAAVAAELAPDDVEYFLDRPLPGTVEADIYNSSRLAPDGYLCQNMEIYITHEPCVMCCHAMLHSRFDRIIFHHRMPLTGALTPERELGLGYGLWWRKELNWRALAWEYKDENEEGKKGKAAERGLPEGEKVVAKKETHADETDKRTNENEEGEKGEEGSAGEKAEDTQRTTEADQDAQELFRQLCIKTKGPEEDRKGVDPNMHA